jgi:hypothetical protein
MDGCEVQKSEMQKNALWSVRGEQAMNTKKNAAAKQASTVCMRTTPRIRQKNKKKCKGSSFPFSNYYIIPHSPCAFVHFIHQSVCTEYVCMFACQDSTVVPSPIHTSASPKRVGEQRRNVCTYHILLTIRRRQRGFLLSFTPIHFLLGNCRTEETALAISYIQVE